jgi:heme oxygenase
VEHSTTNASGTIGFPSTFIAYLSCAESCGLNSFKDLGIFMMAASPPDNAVRVGEFSPAGLRENLKAATASAHRALDTRFGTYDLTSIDGYRCFLEASAAALLPLEAALERSGVADLFADWPQRSRRAAIAADIARTSGTAHLLPAVVTMSRPEMLGAMYVLEGSRLGAKYLLRAVACCTEPQIAEVTHYLRRGSDQPLWRTFLEKLKCERVTPRGEAEMISGAQLAFAMFERAVLA